MKFLKCKIFISILLMISLLFQTGFSFKTKPMQISFINVSAENGTGDATLIDCSGLYILVDTGHSSSYNKLKTFLKKYFGEREIMLDAIIITHNHPDHYGGLNQLLNDPDIMVDDVYYNKINYTNKNIVPTLASFEGSKYGVGVGKKISLNYNGTKINIYGPAKDFTKTDDSSTALNNSSMIVTIQGFGSCILMGDLYAPGINEAAQKYADLFSSYYDVCKYGHHGLRGWDVNTQKDTFARDAGAYNKYIDASYYIFTLKAPTVQSRYLEKLLDGIDVFYMTHDTISYVWETPPSGGAGFISILHAVRKIIP